MVTETSNSEKNSVWNVIKANILLFYAHFKKLLNIAFWFILILAILFIVDRGYLKEKRNDLHVYTYDDVSTSFNERGELTITNRKTGEYKIYSDSVALGMFNMMSAKISHEYKQLSTSNK